MTQDTKKQIADIIWLQYFNRVLYEQGIISESSRNKMALKIECRSPVKGKNTISR